MNKAIENDELSQKEKLSHIKEQASQAVEAKKAVKAKLLADTTVLRNERTALIDRLAAVLKDLDSKGGQEQSLTFYAYMKAVDEIKIDVTDTASTWITIVGWLNSSEGGMRWVKNLAVFLGILFGFWLLSWIVSGIVRRVLAFAGHTSALLQRFIATMVKRLIIITGVLVALTALEVNLTPLLAMIGAMGLVIGFALKDTLGNFASGLMILAYRPFDIGEAIVTNGVAGEVVAMNWVSTVIKTYDNQRITLPNNDVWNNKILNVNGQKSRRIDLVFKIGYQDDVQQVKQILHEVVQQQPLILQDRELIIRLHELADSSVNIICRPWVKTNDYWLVRAELITEAKQRFKNAGISIPHPQRNVHLYQQTT